MRVRVLCVCVCSCGFVCGGLWGSVHAAFAVSLFFIWIWIWMLDVSLVCIVIFNLLGIWGCFVVAHLASA